MISRKSEIWFGVSAIILGLSLPLIANAAPPDGSRPAHRTALGALDANKDGDISATEWNAATVKRFAETDTNKDGFLSEKEMADEQDRRTAEMRKRRAAAAFKRADQDGNGKVSKAEYEATSKKLYEQMQKRKAAKKE